MDLNLIADSIENYHSGTQIARVLTEKWVEDNMFCPRCGNLHIRHFPNNQPVADFFCPLCGCQYELKSRRGSITRKVADGAYETMIRRITDNDNPDFFFMNYSKTELKVKDFIFVPKHFFVPDIIEKRKPLSETARRAGWVGCNILIDKIPAQGRIPIIADSNILDISCVVEKVNKSKVLEINDINSRGWLMDILNCVNKVPAQLFTLKDIYSFENMLQRKYPNNHNIRPKIRQQLQFLRNKGFLEFLGKGKYRKIL